MQRHLVTALFLIVGLINFAPLMGVMGAERLMALYAVDIETPDMLLLMRHRAVLFGIVGGVTLVAAFRHSLRPIAATMAMVSLVSFVMLHAIAGDVNTNLDRVMQIDIAAIIMLTLALWLDKRALPN